MADKVFKSTWTYRTLEYQDKILSQVVPSWPSMSSYIDEDALPYLLRPTQRKNSDDIYVTSIACIARDEKELAEIVKGLNSRSCFLHCVEEGEVLRPKISIKEAVVLWKAARMNGASKVGGRISAKRKEAASKTAIELIREDWPKPSSKFSTQELKDRSGLSLNTIKKHLGSRPIAQYNYQAKLKRKANAKR